ncbi:MAG: hypothetical protein CBD49_00930 [Acidimicrobiaceae bacterium TMED189]|nr:MAG: hypothetical protein CBD49_00930 [Acidimicrobiaceae bacterium TMED189]
MTDTAKVTVSFTQKVSEAPYETADYTLTIERTVPESMGDEGIIAEASGLFEQVKSEVLKQSGQEIDLSPNGVVMRRLKSGVSRASDNKASTPQAAAPSSAPAEPAGAFAQASPVAVSAPAPAGPTAGAGRVYARNDFCMGKSAELQQAAFNLLAFQPAAWADNAGGTIKVYEVKESGDYSPQISKNGKEMPNFSVSKDALVHIGINTARDVGIWIKPADSNVPLKVWDQAGGQTQADAIEWDWTSRRAELHQGG